MTDFIKITDEGRYLLTQGMVGCIVPVDKMIGDLAFIHAPALGLHCKPEYDFLAEPLTISGHRNQYTLAKDCYEKVANPFAHWNKIKGAECVN